MQANGIYQLRTAEPSSHNFDLLLPALMKGNSVCVQVLTLVSPAVFNYPANSSAPFKTNLAYIAMWLIDSTTIRLKFVRSPGSSPYAIISHTWNDNDEVTFQEFNSPDRDIAHSRFLKITETCRLARERGIPYVWVD